MLVLTCWSSAAFACRHAAFAEVVEPARHLLGSPITPPISHSQKGVATTPVPVHTGRVAVEANVVNAAYSLTRTLPSTYPTIDVRCYFRLAHVQRRDLACY